MSTSYLVADHPFDDPQGFRERFFAFLEEIETEDNEFVEADHRETPSQTVTVFSDAEQGETITLWEDSIGRVRYLEVDCDGGDRLTRIAEAFAARFKVIDHDQLVAELRRQPVADPMLFHKLAYSAPIDARPATFDLLMDLLLASDPALRAAAATAAGIIGWDGFEAGLRQALAGESDPDSRAAIEAALRPFS